MKLNRHIVAMGGGGFSEETRNFKLDEYVLSLTGRKNPRVCFVPTASGDAMLYVQKFYRRMGKLTSKLSHLGLFKLNIEDIRAHLLAQDVIYVGGGNTRNMLMLWELWNVDEILREAWEAGIVLAGVSAGGVCWFESCLTDSFGGCDLQGLRCLGLLKGSMCPHFDSEEKRRNVYENLIRRGDVEPGWGVDDGVALHYEGEKLKQVISSKRGKGAYYLSPGRKEVKVVEQVCL